jgi:hypothetical protein
MALRSRAKIPRIPGRVGSRTAYNNPGPGSDISNHGIADKTGSIIIIDVYSVWTGFQQGRVQVGRRLVVNRRIKAKLFEALLRFDRAPGDSNGSTAFDGRRKSQPIPLR